MSKYSDHYSQSLIVEASFNDSERVQNAIESGANPNAQDNIGYTALMRTGSGHIAEYLLNHGASPEVTNHRLETALHIHARNGHQYIVESLIKNNANINAINNVHKNALMVTKNIIVAHLLLDAGINANQVDHNGETALMSLCLTNNTDIATFLIDRNAGLHHKTTSRPNLRLFIKANQNEVNGALIYAKDLGLIEKLIKAGADPSGIDNPQIQSLIEHLKLKAVVSTNSTGYIDPDPTAARLRARL